MTFAIERQKGPVESVESDKCRFSVPFEEVQFAAKDDSKSLLHPITILARSDQPVNHPWWGRIVHDIDGIKLHKSSIVVDYCHSHGEIMGYLDKFEREKGLLASGALVKRPGSRAEEVAINAENKVPYEASIFFDPDHGLVLEEVGEGASVQVNGYTFEGPGVVVRQCYLRAVSICPHGADMATETQFSHQNQTVRLSYKEASMTKPESTQETNPTPETQPQAETQLSQESADKLLDRLDRIETQLSQLNQDPDEPKDLETALSVIKEQREKIAELSKPSANDEAGGSDEGETKLSAKVVEEFQKQIDEMQTRLSAQIQHQLSSDGDSVSGDGAGDTKNTEFRSLFRSRGRQKPDAA